MTDFRKHAFVELNSCMCSWKSMICLKVFVVMFDEIYVSLLTNYIVT